MEKEKITVATEVWIATALLQKENPKGTFSVKEIVDKVYELKLTETLRPGVQVHASTHVVANVRPNPNNLRYLYKTPDGRRRLFWCKDEKDTNHNKNDKHDDYHEYRVGSKIKPNDEEIPKKYENLIEWYKKDWSSKRPQ